MFSGEDSKKINKNDHGFIPQKFPSLANVEKKSLKWAWARNKLLPHSRKRTIRIHKAGIIGLNLYSYYIVYKPLFKINRRF